MYWKANLITNTLLKIKIRIKVTEQYYNYNILKKIPTLALNRIMVINMPKYKDFLTELYCNIITDSSLISLILIAWTSTRLEYIILLKSPIILSGNSFLFTYLIIPKYFPGIVKVKGYSSVAGKITSFKHKIYTQRSIYSNREVTIQYCLTVLLEQMTVLLEYLDFCPILC